MMLEGRLILDPPGNGYRNMAVDKALFESAHRDPRFPVTLRLYGWNPPAISIGRRQKLGETNLEASRKEGIDIVRRFSGGAAVYHSDEITYCFVTRLDAMQKPDSGSWRKIFCALLEKLGLKADESIRRRYCLPQSACFSAAQGDEPLLQGKKWVGSARRKSRSVFLQHGSILLRSKQNILSNLMNRAEPDNSVGLQELAVGVAKDAIASAFISSVESVFNISFRTVSLTEIKSPILSKQPAGISFSSSHTI